MENEVLGLVKNNPNIISTIYGDLAQPSVKKVGIALETVFEFSTSFLLPLKLRNEKVRMNFEKNLNDYKKKIETVPDEELCDVNPQIGTPIIEKLTYTTNEEIADMFTTLLKKASVTSTINEAHPAFVQVIERLSVDEARIVRHLSENIEPIPFVTFRIITKDGEKYGHKDGYTDVLVKCTMLKFLDLVFPENIEMYVSNLVALGILECPPNGFSINSDVYDQLIYAYHYDKVYDMVKDGYNVDRLDVVKGHFFITEFGKAFMKASIQ